MSGPVNHFPPGQRTVTFDELPPEVVLHILTTQFPSKEEIEMNLIKVPDLRKFGRFLFVNKKFNFLANSIINHFASLLDKWALFNYNQVKYAFSHFTIHADKPGDAFKSYLKSFFTSQFNLASMGAVVLYGKRKISEVEGALLTKEGAEKKVAKEAP